MYNQFYSQMVSGFSDNFLVACEEELHLREAKISAQHFEKIRKQRQKENAIEDVRRNACDAKAQAEQNFIGSSNPQGVENIINTDGKNKPSRDLT